MTKISKEEARAKMEKRLAESSSEISPFMTNAQEVAEDGTIYYVDYAPIKWWKIVPKGEFLHEIEYVEDGITKVASGIRSFRPTSRKQTIVVPKEGESFFIKSQNIKSVRKYWEACKK